MNIPTTTFPSYLAKQKDVDAAWELCERRFVSFGAPLANLAARFLQDVAGLSGTHRSYFSNPLAPPLLYMPMWLFEQFVHEGALSPEMHSNLVQILAGTIQGYLYVRTQDDVLDEPQRAQSDLLLLGNACCSGMIATYAQALGSHGHGFWPAFDEAIVDFSRLTLAELKAVHQDEPYDVERFEQHADKVAFARVPLLAIAALADRLDLKPQICKLVHQLGITYGLVNDVIGWPRDLRAGHRTYLLALAGLTRTEMSHIDEMGDESTRESAREALAERLRDRLYTGRLLHETLVQAARMLDCAKESANAIGLRGFDEFYNDRSAWITALDAQIGALTLARVLESYRRPS